MAKVSKRTNDLGALVDKLGELKAEIADLCKQERNIKEQLIETRLPNIDGDLFRATISTHERASLDSELVKMFLTPAQLLQCTKISEVTTVRVNARIKTT